LVAGLMAAALVAPAATIANEVAAGEEQTVIRVPLQAGEPTRLLASSATPDVDRLRQGENGARWVVGWGEAGSRAIGWTVDVRSPGDYAVAVLLDHESGPEATVELRAGGSAAKVASRPTDSGVRYRSRRLTADVPLKLEAGPQSLVLEVQFSSQRPVGLGVFSVELTRQIDREPSMARAAGQRASTAAFAALGHGFMVHYTPESYPRRGARRPWSEAVRDFDVDGFAEQMQRGGAGFAVFVTAHMRWSFPAPLRSIDAQIPGRTTQRDLIDALATALARRGIGLMLYVNPAWDAEVRTRVGDGAAASARLVEMWNATLTEIGERYGDRVFGYWFDKGPWFYQFAPSWGALHVAARAGNPSRLISWNRSRLPMLTDLQDFDSCEKCDDPTAGGHLLRGGDGKYVGGPSPQLQAAATLLAEHPPSGESADPWVHRWPDTEIGSPRWGPRDLADLLHCFSAHRNVPIFNLGIYQDGRVSDRTLEVFARAVELMRRKDAAVQRHARCHAELCARH
jgi:hypothetical protein